MIENMENCNFYHVPFPWKGHGQHAVWKTYNPHEPEYNPHEPNITLMNQKITLMNYN